MNLITTPSVLQVWLRGGDLVHLRPGSGGPPLRRGRDLPLPEVGGHLEGAGRGGRQALPGLHRAGHLLLLPTPHRLLRPALQDPLGEIKRDEEEEAFLCIEEETDNKWTCVVDMRGMGGGGAEDGGGDKSTRRPTLR